MNHTVESRVYARAGLLGNPSDGYGGKTISFAFDKYFASVTLHESDRIVIQPGENDRLTFSSPQELSDHIADSGYYGGIRLVKSAIKRLNDYCRELNLPFGRCFEIRYDSNIPRQVGLAGSSAIVIATLKSLCCWNEIEIDPAILATLALDSEQALGIAAGPQDRVIQTYSGMMYMDFSHPTTRNGISHGQYSRLDVSDDHHFYIAFGEDASEPTEVLHGDLKTKMNRGDSSTVAAIGKIAQLATEGKHAIEARNSKLLAELINSNFDLRQSVCHLNPYHVRMIETARSIGASAKYCGSGGAIVGTYESAEMFDSLQKLLGSIGCTVFRPNIVKPHDP